MACVWSRAVQSHTDVGACITVYKKYVEEKKSVARRFYIQDWICYCSERGDSPARGHVRLVLVLRRRPRRRRRRPCVRLCLHLSGISSVYVFIYTQTTRTSWKVPNNPFMSFPFLVKIAPLVILTT